MSTRSTIWIQEGNGYRGIYCHFDGYLKGVGQMLLDNFTTTEKICALLDLGNISILDKELTKPEGHVFGSPVEGYTLAYGRDRGETGMHATSAWGVRQTQQQDYNYLWRNGAWYVAREQGNYRLLAKALGR